MDVIVLLCSLQVVWFNFTPFNEDSSDEETKPADDGEDTANKKINVYVKSTGVTTIACTEDVFNKDEDIQDVRGMSVPFRNCITRILPIFSWHLVLYIQEECVTDRCFVFWL